ncbi:carboxypeptidase inhibitor SmCI-like, partial [Plutella xylostella]|uniref:carboxypeptidase inhibitor SmCI-like n=1 Tax=Plutella xylostella TaxID=51655 RepID=UPI002032CA03
CLGILGITSIDPDCILPPEPGKCKARLPRYYFDPKTGSCSSKFIYGGCGGNDNRFVTETQCKDTCSSKPFAKSNPTCFLPPEPGRCKARKRRYYFDPTTGSCSSFNYGGCGGNGNRFKTINHCKNKCLPSTRSPEYCQLPFDYGDCDVGEGVKWYYDAASALCLEEIYSGCGGNGNIFDTEEHCYDTCAELKPTNELPKRKPRLSEAGVSAILGSKRLQGILENIFRNKPPKNLKVVFNLYED